MLKRKERHGVPWCRVPQWWRCRWWWIDCHCSFLGWMMVRRPPVLYYHVKLDGWFWVFHPEMILKGLLGSFIIVILVSMITVDDGRCHCRQSMIVMMVVVIAEAHTHWCWCILFLDAVLEPPADADVSWWEHTREGMFHQNAEDKQSFSKNLNLKKIKKGRCSSRTMGMLGSPCLEESKQKSNVPNNFLEKWEAYFPGIEQTYQRLNGWQMSSGEKFAACPPSFEQNSKSRMIPKFLPAHGAKFLSRREIGSMFPRVWGKQQKVHGPQVPSCKWGTTPCWIKLL